MNRPISLVIACLIACPVLAAFCIPAGAQEKSEALSLEEVRERLAGLDSWKADLRFHQRAGAMPVKAAGSAAVRDATNVRLDLSIDIPGLGMPSRYLVVMTGDGMWGEQTLFDKTLAFSARPESAKTRHEYLLHLVNSGGYAVGRLNLAEAVWWAMHGWDLQPQPAEPEHPGRCHYRGKLVSVRHATELFAQPWAGSDMDTLELVVSQDTGFPVHWRVLAKNGKPTYELEFENVVINPAFAEGEFDYSPPEDKPPSDMTANYRPAIQRRLKLKSETEALERKAP